MPISIIQATKEKDLFSQWFKDERTWAKWFVFLKAFFALPMNEEELAIYHHHTKRDHPPKHPCTEGWVICGRRAGKSFTLALIATYLATFREYEEYLQPGERATVLIIASDRKQARQIFGYIRGFLTHIPLLNDLIERETADSFELVGSVNIEVGTASYKSVRGYTLACALLDEAAFYPTDESAEPDIELLRAVRPGLGNIPDSVLLVASSPYAKRGILYQAYKNHFANDDDPVLVWKGTTREMNATIDEIAPTLIDSAMAEDPIAASAEYFAEFRSDVEGFVSREALEECVVEARERPYQPSTRYFAFVDPSGGKEDSFTLAIAHKDDDIVCLDCIREVIPPFSPEFVCKQFADTMRTYGITRCAGDHFAGIWPVEQFKRFGITYTQNARPKSELYQRLLPLVNSQQVELLRHEKMLLQLQGLERRTSRSGKDSIDHAANSHDDVANAVAGVIALASDVMRRRATTFVIHGEGAHGKVVALNPDPKPRSWQRRVMTAEEARKRREAMN